MKKIEKIFTDHVDLHKAFLQYLREPKPPEDFESNNPHQINIRWYELSMHEEKSDYIGHYSRMIRIILPRLKNMCRLVNVPELGGHIEMKEEDYDELYKEYVEEHDYCNRLYASIKEYEDWIAAEYKELEAERDNVLLGKYRYEEWKKSPIDAPRCPGKQLELFDLLAV